MTYEDVVKGRVCRGDRIRHIPSGKEFIADDFIPRDVHATKMAVTTTDREFYDVAECEKI